MTRYRGEKKAKQSKANTRPETRITTIRAPARDCFRFHDPVGVFPEKGPVPSFATNFSSVPQPAWFPYCFETGVEVIISWCLQYA
jgi:hypothetical protein